MNQLLLANVIAPSFLLLGRAKALYVFIGIILVEALALWFVFNKVVKIQLSFPKLLLISMTANVLSALLGVVVPYSAFNLTNLRYNLMSLVWAFLGSSLIEWGIYIPFIRFKGNSIINSRLEAAIIVNLCSYVLLIPYVLYISIITPEVTRYYKPRNEARFNIETIMETQQTFYLKNSRFASSFKEIKNFKEPNFFDEEILIKTDTQAEGFYYIYQISADPEKVQLTLKPKQLVDRDKSLKSYTAILFSQPELLYEICMTEQPSSIPPATPQQVEDEIQCPPGSKGLRIGK